MSRHSVVTIRKVWEPETFLHKWAATEGLSLKYQFFTNVTKFTDIFSLFLESRFVYLN